MLKNYLTIALRNLVKHKGYSLINVAGLAIGMTCFMLISLFVWNNNSWYTYFVLAEGQSTETVEAKLSSFTKTHLSDSFKNRYE